MIIYVNFCSVLNNSDFKQKLLSNEELSQIECQINLLSLFESCLSDKKKNENNFNSKKFIISSKNQSKNVYFN